MYKQIAQIYNNFYQIKASDLVVNVSFAKCYLGRLVLHELLLLLSILLPLLLLLLVLQSNMSLSLSVVVVLQLSVVVRGLNAPQGADAVDGAALLIVPTEECSDALSSQLPVDRLLQATEIHLCLLHNSASVSIHTCVIYFN